MFGRPTPLRLWSSTEARATPGLLHGRRDRRVRAAARRVVVRELERWDRRPLLGPLFQGVHSTDVTTNSVLAASALANRCTECVGLKNGRSSA